MRQREFVALGLVLAGLLCPPGGFAQESKKDISGVVQELDAVTGTITLIVKESAKAQPDRVRTFNLLKPDLPVTDAAGQALKLTDLQPDDRVALKMSDDDVIAIRRAPPTLFGSLTKVDLPGRSLLVATKIGDKSVVVPDTAKVYHQNLPAQLQDLKPGTPILVAFAQDKTVLEVRSSKGQLPVTKLTKGVGVLIDFDRERHVVQILINALAGDHFLLRDFTLAKEPSFALFYHGRPFRELSGDELRRGVRVEFWTDIATRKVVHIAVEMPILGNRQVKTIDQAKRQLTLADHEEDRELTLAPQLRVLTKGGPGRLEQVQAESVVSCGLSPDRRAVEVIVVVGK
jgi:hypothetical protein